MQDCTHIFLTLYVYIYKCVCVTKNNKGSTAKSYSPGFNLGVYSETVILFKILTSMEKSKDSEAKTN